MAQSIFVPAAPLMRQQSYAKAHLGQRILIDKAKIVEQRYTLWLNNQMHKHFFIIFIGALTAFYYLQALD